MKVLFWKKREYPRPRCLRGVSFAMIEVLEAMLRVLQKPYATKRNMNKITFGTKIEMPIKR